MRNIVVDKTAPTIPQPPTPNPNSRLIHGAAHKHLVNTAQIDEPENKPFDIRLLQPWRLSGFKRFVKYEILTVLIIISSKKKLGRSKNQIKIDSYFVSYIQ